MNTAPNLLRFADLRERQIVTSWPQLRRLVDKHGFPAGYMLSPAVRVWDAEDIRAWLQSRRDAATDRRASADQVAA